MKTKRNFIVVLLLLLLMVQQSVLAHTVTHWNNVDPSQQEQQLPHEQMCEQCIAFAQFGSSLASNFSIPLADNAAYPAPICQLTQEILAQTFCVFQPRAPPTA